MMKCNCERSSTIVIGFVFCCIQTFCLLSYSHVTQANQAESRAMLVSTAIPEFEDWPVEIFAQGEVKAWELGIVSSKTSGISATNIYVIEGDTVKKGQVLAQFDIRLLQAQVNQQKANVSLAQANLNFAKDNLERFKQKKFRQSLSPQEFEAISNQKEIAVANFEQALAALALAEFRLEDATVISPDDGIVLMRNIEHGQVTQSGEVLFHILRQNKLEWVAEVDPSELTNIRKGMRAQLDVLGSSPLFGTVLFVSPQLSIQSRLGKVHVLLAPKLLVPVNSYLEGAIIVGNHKALVIPAHAVVVKDGKNFVFSVNDGIAEQKLVQIGRRLRNKLEVLSGININDSIVVDGAGFLNDGDKIITQEITQTEQRTTK